MLKGASGLFGQIKITCQGFVYNSPIILVFNQWGWVVLLLSMGRNQDLEDPRCREQYLIH